MKASLLKVWITRRCETIGFLSSAQTWLRIVLQMFHACVFSSSFPFGHSCKKSDRKRNNLRPIAFLNCLGLAGEKETQVASCCSIPTLLILAAGLPKPRVFNGCSKFDHKYFSMFPHCHLKSIVWLTKFYACTMTPNASDWWVSLWKPKGSPVKILHDWWSAHGDLGPFLIQLRQACISDEYLDSLWKGRLRNNNNNNNKLSTVKWPV